MSATNRRISEVLRQAATLLEAQGANQFRCDAYRAAALRVARMRQPIGELIDRRGPEALTIIPGIGNSLAHSIAQISRTGTLRLLERIDGSPPAERRLRSVAGIGPKLAHRIREHLGVETTRDLALAVRDGRLARVPGMGARRLKMIRETLDCRYPNPRPAIPVIAAPSVAELLDIDREYRERTLAEELPQVRGRAVLHTERGTRHYTAAYTNTKHDWVWLQRDDAVGRGTWIAYSRNGRRMVHGREAECAFFYDALAPRSSGIAS